LHAGVDPAQEGVVVLIPSHSRTRRVVLGTSGPSRGDFSRITRGARALPIA